MMRWIAAIGLWVLSMIIVASMYSQKRVSVLTCGQGQEVYSTFGHSAIRIVDSTQGTDWVYNYGQFDFTDPAFIPKFIHGKLDYMLGKELFEDFMYQYQYFERSVSEQVLSLSVAECDSLQSYLDTNALEANRGYRYDFLYDNCATRVIRVLSLTCPHIRLRYATSDQPSTHRQLIHRYAAASVPMLDWGMDLLIGARTDRTCSAEQYSFLPDYVAMTLDRSCHADGRPLVAQQNTLLKAVASSDAPSYVLKPIVMAMILMILALISPLLPLKLYRVLHFVIFSVAGMAGILIVYEWLMTEHQVTKYNFNCLWLNPLMLLYAFVYRSRARWVHYLRYLLLACIASVALVHIVLGQNYHSASVVTMVGLAVWMLYPILGRLRGKGRLHAFFYGLSQN